MFSEKDRETISHIRSLFSHNGNLPQCEEKNNMIILHMKGSYDDHPFYVTCIGNVLRIITVKSVPVIDCSIEVLKYVSEMNLGIPLGDFCYDFKERGFVYKMGVPLFGMPSKKMVVTLLTYSVKVLDECLPEIFSIEKNCNIAPKKQEDPTYH